MDVLGLLIDNNDEGASDGRAFERANPITGEVATRVAAASIDDANKAANAAARAFPEWSNTSPGAKRKLLLDAATRLEEKADEFVAAMAAETGATAGWARG